MKKLVVVVLLNYNQNEYSLKCVESLLGSDYENFKIMLVDNGSSKANFDNLNKNLPNNNKLLVKRIPQNIGYAQGTNLGLKEGLKMNPHFFLIMNNDTIIDKSAISELVITCLKYNEKALVTGKVYDYSKSNMLQFVGYKFKNKKMLTYTKLGLDELDEGQYDKIEERDMIDDVFVLQPADFFKLLGGYSSYLWLNGVNVDLALRGIEKGYKLIYTPKAKLWHKGSASIGGREMNSKLAYWHIQSSLIVRYLHLSKARFIVYYLYILKSVLGTSFKSQLNKNNSKIQSNYAMAKWKGLIYFNNWVFKKNSNNGFNPF